MTKALGRIDETGIENIRLSGEDGVRVLDCCRKPRSTACCCSTPIPGRRSGTGSGASSAPTPSARFARVLKDGGEFWFASDIDTYVDWTLRHVRASV